MLRLLKVSKTNKLGEEVRADRATTNLGLFVTLDSANQFANYIKKDLGEFILVIQAKSPKGWMDIEIISKEHRDE